MLYSVHRNGCVSRLIMEKQSFDRNCSVIYIALSCLPELIADLVAIAVDSVAYAVEEAICLAVDKLLDRRVSFAISSFSSPIFFMALAR